MLTKEQKALVLEYGRLATKILPGCEDGGNIPPCDRVRMVEINDELDMSHQEILKELMKLVLSK